MFMLFPILLLGGGMGGANELIDYLQTEHYWKTRNITPDVATLSAMLITDPKAEDISELIKQLGHDDFNKREAASEAIGKKGPSVIPQLKEATQSKDAEIADRALRLITQLSGGDIDPAIHRLMIIRSLGETKDKAALAALKTQLDSKEPFASEYARRAIANIEGLPYQPAGTAVETYEKDLWLLPNGVKLVTQMTMTSSGPADWAKVLANANNPFGGNLSKEDMFREMQSGVAMALNTVGNIRIDGFTLGVSDNPGPNTGYAVVLVRGRYSRDKLKTMFKSQGIEVIKEDGIDSVMPPDANLKLLFVSDELLLVIGGPRNAQAWPVKEMTAAIKAGKGTLSDDAKMVKLINAADRKSGGWAAIQMTDAYRSGAPWMKPFDTVLVSRKSEKGKTTIKVVGTGSEAEAIQSAVNEMNKGLEELRANMNQAAGFVPKPMIDFMNSLKVEAEGKSAALTGTMEGSTEDIIGSMLFPMMMMMRGPG